MRRLGAILLVVLWSFVAARAVAESGGAAPPAESKAFDWGGDLRLRGVNFDDIPVSKDPPGVARGGPNVFFRGRTRIWGEFKFSDQVLFKTRMTNEFRSYEEGSGKNAYDFPDEYVFDNLYLDVKDLFDGKFDLRLGRQDLMYANGRILMDGTPLDGSRTFYYNAAKGTLKWEKTSVDILGIYDPAEDDLAINTQHRDLVGLVGAYPTDMVESGGGIYAKNKSIQKMPLELYYLFKNESDYEWTDAQGAAHKQPYDLDLHTFGFRLMPQLTESLTGNLEGAGQFGERGPQDVQGWMVDAKLSYAFQVAEKVKPSASVGLYYLSGDDPDTADDEGWNPLWARWPQYSELYVYAFDHDGAGRWSNLTMPYVGLDVPFSSKLSLALLTGYMFAPERSANIPGSDDERGLLATAWFRFKLSDKWFGHFLAEFVDPGDYYKVDNTAHFIRVEFSCLF